MLPFLTDLAVFLLLPLLVWRLVRPVVPLAVVPVLIGLAVAGLAALNGQRGPEFLPPTEAGDALGMLGVILLAFSAGLEGRDPGHLTPGAITVSAPSPGRILRSAGVALALPFGAGTLLAWGLLSAAEGWRPAGLSPGLAAAAIGLCLAVSALPVLVALLRELPAGLRPLGAVAVRVAALDDMALWLGLGLLMALGRSQAVSGGFGVADLAAVGVLALLGFAPLFFGHRGLEIDPRLLTPDVLGWVILLLVVSMISKIAAVQMVPPLPGLSRHRRLTLGVFLQCKGLMEIVAATLLLKSGLLTATAYAALVMLALVSTTLTAPLVRMLMPGCLRPAPGDVPGDVSAFPDGSVVSGKADTT